MTTLSFKSSSLFYSHCSDSIRFSFQNDLLQIVTRKNNQERLDFNIIKTKEKIINNITHTILISEQGDTFYIVNNKFHREGDLPAITMRRFIILNDSFEDNDDNKDKVWAKIWMKNGLYHRTCDKPALIFQNNDLLWMEEGHFKRNPFTNASIYTPNENQDKLISCERTRSKIKFERLTEKDLQRHFEEKLLEFSYDNA
jgi:hypothetical protein